MTVFCYYFKTLKHPVEIMINENISRSFRLASRKQFFITSINPSYTNKTRRKTLIFKVSRATKCIVLLRLNFQTPPLKFTSFLPTSSKILLHYAKEYEERETYLKEEGTLCGDQGRLMNGHDHLFSTYLD